MKKFLKTKKYSILSNILKYSFVAVFVLFLVGSVVSADTAVTFKLANPIPGVDNLGDFIKKALEIIVIVGVPIVVLAIIYTGFLFIEAQGKPEKITKAKNALLYVLIGAALLLGASVIASAIGKTVVDIGNGV